MQWIDCRDPNDLRNCNRFSLITDPKSKEGTEGKSYHYQMYANYMPYVDSNSMTFYPFSVDKSFDCYSLTSPYTASLGRQVWAARDNEA